MFSQPEPKEEKAESAENTSNKDTPQQIAPGTKQLDPEIPHHRRQRVVGVANRPIQRTLQPAYA